MSRWTVVIPTWTPTAVADTTAFTSGGHVSIQGGTSTQRVNILEVFCGGAAAAGAPMFLQLARHSTVGATLTALAGPNSIEPRDPAATALANPPAPFVASTTQPQADANAKLDSFAFNAFGGLVRKTWNPGEGPIIQGNAASSGELGLNAFTGGTVGLMGSHIEYEPL